MNDKELQLELEILKRENMALHNLSCIQRDSIELLKRNISFFEKENYQLSQKIEQLENRG